MKKNAIILAAGTASRFIPLSLETPKGLLEVKGEVLIERQIRQLQQAGIADITLVVGYMAEKFAYLAEKYGVSLVFNKDYDKYNNISSLIRVLDRLGNTYVLTSDNYYPDNIFINDNTEDSYYSALFTKGATSEYCLDIDPSGYIKTVNIGGKDAWYMYGPVFFSNTFSKIFTKILIEAYKNEENRQLYWEDIYMRHIPTLKMKIRRREENEILEFDSLDELRKFDTSYITNTRNAIVASIASQLNCSEGDLTGFCKIPESKGISFNFKCKEVPYQYSNGNITLTK